ncbi:hypothetical protein PC121_g15692 [Phytophthora cactorum]|nr:hypothetical protein PC120_g10738 [Phytophthora cactorum]KAG3055588.1 hypothetical protein PC121_g15692 [Phytophthora cactorum]KAG4050139.1 hypothetical protein PC123_g14613 [Phytophthora cactorum]
MSEADLDDVYASDEYEPESPTRLQPSPTHAQQSPVLSAAVPTFQLDANLPDDDESEFGAVTPLPREKSKRGTPRESNALSGRHLMDNTPWTYTVSALQVRMLRIPVVDSAAIRELRVFATIDKQAAQSRGSRWKQELHSVGGGSPLRSTKKRGKRNKSLRRVEPYRRSGLIEEAKWMRADGKLQWTFPMERFRRLKAYAPRIKAFVYGIGEAGAVNHSRAQMENLARQEKDGAILSFGWFFLDLRTPDLPERWLKLQNSPFGGEILISSTFLPVELSSTQPAQSVKKSTTQTEDKGHANVPAETRKMTVNKAEAVPTVVSGENGEYLQIGDGSGPDIFELSVFIQAAFNLLKVVETSMGENRHELEQTGFWLSYSLFDVVVQTDIFHNLSVAEFSPIRDSFRVKTSLKDLTLCLEAVGNLSVFMCTENRVLAGVEIPLHQLLLNGFFAEGTNKPRLGDTVDIDGKFSFPDFEDAVISASVAVELVESKDTRIQRDRPENNKSGQNPEIEVLKQATTTHDDETIPAETCEVNAGDQVLFKLDHIRLKTLAISRFTGEENLCLEVVIGEQEVSGVLEFCSYTKQQAFATCVALGAVLENFSCQTALDTVIRIRCFASVSNNFVASSSESAKAIQDDEGYPRSIVFPMLNESKQSVGQCTLTCTRGPEAHQQLGRELLRDAIQEERYYRLCLKLKSVRDIEIPGGYSLRYLNPFLSSAPVTSDWFTVKDKGELESLSFYCMFNLTKNPLQLKQEMQESVRIDLISSDEETVGSAVFSMSYLYFSEEHFCCSEDSCGEIFKTQSETEAHWLEVHTDSKLPDTQAGPEAYSHSYRSCSINIPIVSADISNGSAVQQPRRVGSIRVSAFLEDIGLLTEKHAAAQRAVLTLSSPPLQEKVNIKEETLDESRLHEDVSAKKVREQSTGTSVLREAEETSRNTPATRGVSTVEVSADNSHEEERARQLREREKEAAQLKETLERERSAWKQEQHLQQLQWKRRFAEMEKARMDELEEEWARREEERSNLLKVAQEEYQRLEQTLRKSLADLETRERRLAVAESALQREQEAKRDENDSLQRRLKSEQSHTLSLAKKQTEAYERRIALLESQLSDAERRAKQVEADFAEYRQQQRKLPESKLREEIAALKGNVSELEKQKMAKERECEIAEANIGKMKAQVDQMAGLLNREKKKHEARVVDELEKLRVKYIAREEKYVLDGDRDELRAIKKQLDDLKGYKLRGNGGKRRFHRQRSHESPSPQHHRNHWHTQSRQTAFVHHSRSSSEHYHPGSSFHSDHAYGDASDWEASSCVEIRRVDTTPQLTSREPQGEREYSSSRSHIFNHEGSLATDNFDTDQDQGELEDSEDTHGGPPDTELGRLLRERKLLLDSGAYDAQSYLVRELDRLISVTKAKAGHQSVRSS